MIKFFVVVALLHCCVVSGQHHGSFLGVFQKPLCAAEGTFVSHNQFTMNLLTQKCVNETQKFIGLIVKPYFVSFPLFSAMKALTAVASPVTKRAKGV